ncbi:MAG: M3 family metallopeptidase [Propioniciclava sp.]
MTEVTELSPLILPAPEAAAYLAWLNEGREAIVGTEAEATTLSADPPADTTATLEAWNRISLTLGDVSARSSLISEVHPDPGVREAAEELGRAVQQLGTRLGLDPDLHAVFAACDPSGLGDDQMRLLDHTLRSFRRSGVAAPPATRERICAIRERLTVLGQTFGRTIREGTKAIRLRPEQLDGLPADWIQAHPANTDGLVTVTTDSPDALPFRMFAHDADARHDLLVAALTVGYPENEPVLQEIFALRAELAGLLGYPSWPDFDTEVKMIGSGDAIATFIDQITDAATGPAERDLAVLLELVRRDRPEAVRVTSADAAYYTEVHRREALDVDAQQVRTYFDFAKVRAGLLEVTGRLFGLEYVPQPDAPVWHPEVTVHDVRSREDGTPVGRIYLDLHPRPGKFKHAAQFTLSQGVGGQQLPEGALVCNLSAGLMEHSDVATLFHEFGHLIHALVGGQQPWVDFSGIATEWDFVEAPSQMLEEWAWDASVLQTFATDADGRPIPADLVNRMRAAHDFGKGTFARTQMFYAALSYYLHRENPDDLRARTAELQQQYGVYPYIEGTCMPASFGHLDGYGSGYYTYMWSMVIAKDLFSAFDPEDLLAPEVAARYRDTILAPGGSRDAADLVRDFLGRGFTFDAYAAWLAR